MSAPSNRDAPAAQRLPGWFNNTMRAWRRRREALERYQFFSALSDELLRDVGISETTIRLLRNGRFPGARRTDRAVLRDDLFMRAEGY